MLDSDPFTPEIPRTVAKLLLCLLALSAPRADAAEPRLPPPWAHGALCSGIAPCARSGSLAGHLRFTVPVLDLQDPAQTRPGLLFGLSVGLWHWAELGASWYAELQRAAPGTGGLAGVAQGPITLWGRLSPPPLSALFSDYPDRGLFLAAQVDHASATPPFDGGGQLLLQVDTVTLISEWRSSRVSATLSAAAQIGDQRRYLGGQAAAGLWVRIGQVLRVGGEALGRAGALDGDTRLGWVALLGISLLEDEGLQASAAYLRGDGRDLPAHAAIGAFGYSLGPGYRRPPPDPTYPVLIPELDLWTPLQAAWARRGAPGFGAANAWPAAPLLAACALPVPLDPIRIVSRAAACVAGWSSEMERAQAARCPYCLPDPATNYGDGRAGYAAGCLLVRWWECGLSPWQPSTWPAAPRPGALGLPPGVRLPSIVRGPTVASARPPAPAAAPPPPAGPAQALLPTGPPPRPPAPAPPPRPPALPEHAPVASPTPPPAAEHARPSPSSQTPRGGAGPVLQGQRGVEKEVARQEGQGNRTETEVTIDTPAGRRRVDVLVTQPDGKQFAVEVKTGNSPYTPKQQAKDRAMATKGGVPAGQKANQAGLKGPVRLPTEVVRYR